MEESKDGDVEENTVVSSLSSDLDPMENMVAIPIPTPSVIHTLVEIPKGYVPPFLHSTPSPPYIKASEADLLHDGVPEYWADPEVSSS